MTLPVIEAKAEMAAPAMAAANARRARNIDRLPLQS
jgi:hypothetical protein